MGQPAQYFQAVIDDLARTNSLDIGDEADATGVMLIAWISEPTCRQFKRLPA